MPLISKKKWLYDWSYYDIGHMNGHVAEYSLNE